MNKDSIYSESFPVSLRDYSHLADAYCCGEIRMTHATCEAVADYCVFCEGECPNCERPIF